MRRAGVAGHHGVHLRHHRGGVDERVRPGIEPVPQVMEIDPVRQGGDAVPAMMLLQQEKVHAGEVEQRLQRVERRRTSLLRLRLRIALPDKTDREAGSRLGEAVRPFRQQRGFGMQIGAVRRGYLGVNIVDLGFEEAEAFGLKSTDGALVTRVMENSPAEDAGLKYGDIIVEVNGKRISSNRELIDYVSARPPGEKVDLRAFRNGDYVDVQITLGERPGVDVPAVEPREEETSEIDWLGIKYQDIDNQTRQNHSMPDDLQGVWVTQVAPDSPLYDKGVRPGDVIVDVNGNKITSGKDLESVASEVPSGKFLRIYLNRIDPRSGVANSYFAVIRVP